MCEDYCTVYEVAIDGDKLGVVAGLEVLPSEVVVFGLRCICTKDIAEDILLSFEVTEIFVKPDGPVA